MFRDDATVPGKVWKDIADLVMPRVCLVCGKILDAGEDHLCAACWKDLPRTRYWKLRENPMAESFNALIQRGMGEDVRYQPYGYAVALYFYKGGYREISKSLKYRRNFAAGRCFGRLLGRTLAEVELFRDVDLVVPVPLHWTRRWQRGYNQAEVIAKEVARELGARYEPRGLRRVRRTKTQTHLNVEGRAANVAGVFQLSYSSWRRMARRLGDIPLRHVLLIDDVFTTGATAAAAERAFRVGWLHCGGDSVPPIRISVATLACVEH